MLIGHKHKVYHRPPPAIEFDKFLKIRSEKQSIIQVTRYLIEVIIPADYIKSPRILGSAQTDQNRHFYQRPTSTQKTSQQPNEK